MSIKYTINREMIVVANGKFPKTRIAALRESIRKWKWLVKYLTKYQMAPLTGTDSCSLCSIFIQNDCFGCPVFEYTGEPYCSKTPYAKYANIRNYKPGIKYAQQEVEFLESLLPTKKK